MFDYDEQDYEVDVDFDELESFDNPAQEEINSEDIEESAIEAVTSDFTVSEEIVEQLKDKMKDILSIYLIHLQQFGFLHRIHSIRNSRSLY